MQKTTTVRFPFSDTTGTGDANAVSIPAAVQGRPVTGISTNAFLFHATLREVTLPESIACIGMNAFGECSSLTSINL